MNNSINKKPKPAVGPSYIIGRSGHIYINDPAVSKQHAVIQILGKKVYLRDLGSTNGTYLIVNKTLVPFTEGYVALHQSIVIGSRHYTIQSLLKIIGSFRNNQNKPKPLTAAASSNQVSNMSTNYYAAL